MMANKYECDRCGACCQGTLIVEAEWLDALREPRLLDADVTGRQQTIDDLFDETRCVIIAGSKPCKFLDHNQRCMIYPTRPNDCVGMQAGDEQCQDARNQCGLAMLQPV